MNPVKGHYAVVQYCPDPSRLEAANIGVVLFCPSIGFLKVRLARDNERIRRFFGRVDETLVSAAKEALASRLEMDAQSFRRLDDLVDFANRRANDLRLTPFRSVQVADPLAELDALFERLAGERRPSRQLRSATAAFGAALKQAQLAHALRRSVIVKAAGLDRAIRAPYGYRNGRFNLIEPVSFRSAESAFPTACTRAIEGEAVYATRHPELGLLKMIVVGQFSPQSRDAEPTVRKVLSDHKVDFYPMEDIKPLLDDIRAHELANVLR